MLLVFLIISFVTAQTSLMKRLLFGILSNHSSLLLSMFRKLCDPSMVTFCKDGGSQLLTGLGFVQFSLNNGKLDLHWEKITL